MELAKKKKKISVKELVLYIITGTFAAWGLVYIVLGLLANLLPIKDANNPLKNGSDVVKQYFGLGFLGWGLILFGVFALIGVIVMVTFARDVDKDYEKEQRRAARLQRNKTTDAPEVVDAEVSE